MSRNRSSFPNNLQEHLRDADDRDDLVSVWRVLGRLKDPTLDDVSASAGSRASDRSASDPAHAPSSELEAAWEAVQQRTFGDPRPLSSRPTNDEGAPASPTSSTRHRDRPSRTPRRSGAARRPRWLGATLVAVLLIVGGAIWWQQPVTVQAPSGTQVTATLPDGSTVDLNSGTTIRYQRGFNAWPGVSADRRIVELDGEAYFSVTHNDHPFEVRTFNSRIEVLGTEFNVRGHSDGLRTDVVVASGRVRVAPAVTRNDSGTDGAVVLDEPGQSSRVTDDVASRATVDVERVLAWRRAGFAVSDQPLAIVARELQRRYDLTILITPDARAQGGSLSLYYTGKVKPETIIHDLCTARGLSYRPISNGFEIYVDPSSPRSSSRSPRSS